MSDPRVTPPPNERSIVALIGAIQFVNILDFMMVMPLGPDFAGELHVASSQMGLVGGSYTGAAAVAGLLGAFFLDRFDRKKALALCMAGLACGTLAGAFATDLSSLLAARILAGAFGGPATSVALSIIADAVPAERRGRAMGAVMGAFSVASVVGIPVGLELSHGLGWRAPFLAVAALSLLITVAAISLLPSMTQHLKGERSKANLGALFTAPHTAFSAALVAVTMASSFLLVPNFSPYLQGNLHFPREHLGVLYGIGGALSFGSMRLVGRLVDRLGSARVNAGAVAAFVAVVVMGFVLAPPALPVLVIFPLFMIVQTSRNVSQQTLLSKVPRPHERAGFMSVQSAISHLSSAVAAIAGSALLTPGPGGSIVGMGTLGVVSIALAVLATPLFFLVERAVRALQPSPSLTASR